MPIATQLEVDGQQKKYLSLLLDSVSPPGGGGGPDHYSMAIEKTFHEWKKRGPTKTKQKKASHGPKTKLLNVSECDPSTEYKIYLFSHTKIIKSDRWTAILATKKQSAQSWKPTSWLKNKNIMESRIEEEIKSIKEN